MPCDINRNSIRNSIQDEVATLALNSKLFTRVDATTLHMEHSRPDLIEKARSLADNVKGMYAYSFKDNTEESLYEAAVQAHSSDSEKQGVLNTFGEDIVNIADQLHPEAKVGTSIFDKTDNVVSMINQAYETPIIKRQASVYKIDVPDSLIDEVLDEYSKSNSQDLPVKEVAPTWDSNSEQDIREAGDVPLKETPVEWLQRHAPEHKNLANFLKANSTLKTQFSDGWSQFDPLSNTIIISLPELYDLSIATNRPFKQVIANFIEHEMAHAASYFALETGKNDAPIRALMKIAMDFHAKIPFEDGLRQGTVEENGLPYAFKDIHEFVADTFGNPFFAEYLKQIPVGKKTLWDKIIDFFRRFMGMEVKDDNVYDQVVDYINSDKIQKINDDNAQIPQDQDMVLVYRGNPRNYIDATNEYFTTSDVSDKIQEVMSKLPQAIIKLKNSLDEETDKAKRATLQSLINSYNDVKGNEKSIAVYINMLTTAAKIAKDLQQQLITSDKLPEDKRIHMAYSLYQSAQGLQFIAPLVTDVVTIMEQDPTPKPGVNRFLDQLRGINSVVHDINRQFRNIVTPAMMNYFTSLNTESPVLASLAAQLKEYEEKLKDANLTPQNRKYFEAKAEEMRANMMKIPSEKVFKHIFEGDFLDASAAQMNLEAASMNAHPLVASLMSKIRNLDIELSQDMLSVENRQAKAFTKLVKENKLGLRETNKTWDPISDIFEDVDQITMNEDGTLNITYMPRKMLLSQYSPEYLKTAITHQKVREYYYERFLEAKRNSNDDEEERFYNLYQAQISEQRKFYRDNSEQRYTDQVYSMYDMLDREMVRDDGSVTSFRKERGDIFSEIEELEHRRNAATSLDEQQFIQERIKEVYIRLREIRSIYDEQGNEKTGFAKRLSDLAIEYGKLRNQYGTYTLTEEGLASFEREVNDITKKFNDGTISEAQKNALISELTVSEIDDSFYETMDALSTQLADINDRLMTIPEVADILKGINKDKIREGYSKIRALVSGFRDNEGVIDGILFSRVRPDLVKEIRDIQQEMENLKNASQRLKGLSVTDSMRLSQLYTALKNGTITDDERNEMQALQNERNEKGNIYKANKELIDQQIDLQKQISAMWDSKESQYYLDAKDTELNRVLKDIKDNVRVEMVGATTLENGKYFIDDEGKWVRRKRRNADTGEIEVEAVQHSDDYPAEERIIDEIAKARAELALRNSEWWRNNHITAYEWSVKDSMYKEVERPMYIWTKTEPDDKSFILTRQPSIKFQTYKINDEFLNQNHKELLPYIPVNKAGKYENTKYNELRDSKDAASKNYFQYLEFLRNEYQRAQAFYPANKKMGDILPGIVKTHDELKVEATNNALRASTYKKLVNFGAGEAGNQDTQLITGGSQTKYYSQKRILPTRFTGKVKADEQSSDLPGMVMAFTLAARRFNKFSEVQPIFESLRTVVENLPVTENISKSNKLSVRNLVSAIKGNQNRKETRVKQTDKSNLSKTIDHVLDTFMYEEFKDASTTQVLGMNVDWQKASTNLKRFSSLALFSAKMFIPIKNTLAAKIASTINSNVGLGFYTNSDYARAQLDSAKYVKDFVSDYKKFGDKSFIGQAIQYFQVLNGNTYNEYGKKTQWTELKNLSNYLTILKNISEFELQITQFLAMSRANMVTVDGKEVPFLEAFELDKNHNFVMKKGASIPQEDVNRFIKRIQYINRVINGAYRSDERNRFQKTVLGDLAFYLNGYVIPGITNRFAGTRYSSEADMITRGYWNQTFNFIGELIKYKRGINEQWGDLNAEEKARVMRFTKELSFMIGLAILGAALGSGDDKKHLRENSALHNYMLAMTMAVKSETETFTPAPGLGLNEIARKLNSPFAAVRQISNIAQLLENSAKFTIGDSSAFYKKTGIHDGFHDKGDAKALANLLRIIGYTGVEFDPLEKVSRVRQAQQLR